MRWARPSHGPEELLLRRSTQIAIIRLLASGVMSSAEVKEAIKKSREHTARMKSLFDKGLVTRDDSARPFVYQLTERGRAYLGSSGA